MVRKVVHQITWEFANGLTGKAWVYYGLEELRAALTDSGATVTVSVPTASSGARQTAVQRRSG